MFSKKPTQHPVLPAARPQANRPMSQAPTFSILGADVAIKGDVIASAELHVDGKIEGDVSCASLVQGTITVGELTILKSAQINGDVFYDSLTMEPGAQVDGRLATRATVKREPSLIEDNSEPILTLASSAS